MEKGRRTILRLVILSVMAVTIVSVPPGSTRSLSGVASAEEPKQASNGGCVAGEEYDPVCDVNRNGIIDIVDIMLVVTHWRQEGTWTIDGVIPEDSITWRHIKDTRRVVVAGDGSGDYTTIGEALNNMDCYTGLLPDPPHTCAILVMPGTYEENVLIQEKEWIHIMGFGPGVTTIRARSFLWPVFDLELANHIIISGLTIKGGDTGIRLTDSTDVTIMHNDITDNLYCGVHTGGFSPRIMHNRIERNGEVGLGDAGIHVDGGSPVITDNDLRDNAVGIFVNDGWPKISGNIFVNYISILLSGSGGEIVSNDITGGRAGILVQYNSPPVIRGNRIDGGAVGIEVTDSSSPEISENWIEDTQLGIMLYETTGSTRIIRNTIMGSGDGIRAESSSAVLAILQNTILDNERYGIFLGGYSNTTRPLDGGGAIISHNAVYGTLSGVDVRVSDCALGSYVTISHNIVGAFNTSIVCVEGGHNTRVDGLDISPY